ncbi:hypothetical protein Tco_1467776 [Tanacetum coccineum]
MSFSLGSFPSPFRRSRSGEGVVSSCREGAKGPSRVPISTSSPSTLWASSPPCCESLITWPFSRLSRLGYRVSRMTPMLMPIYGERLDLASTDATDFGPISSFNGPAPLEYASTCASLTKVASYIVSSEGLGGDYTSSSRYSAYNVFN